ncbi:hypothetical protein AB205_0191900 [Aquarana catesbeiana]|uniref:Uncharacterized protein n=1 Tax=Aquarana catesbeiana TaxID=8400 RepID=A0A2G9Q5E5_AQUCT|nr:hypothetical protein AB205_0191900 [Aquarana catesbeiana]
MSKFCTCTRCVIMCYLPSGISMYLFCVCSPFIRIMLVCERNKGIAHTKHVHCSPMMGDSTC